MSNEYFAMVHKPIPLPLARTIPDAAKAIQAEMDKHNRIKTWDVTKVQPRAKVKARAKRDNITVHFGHLMMLCHLKNSELAKELQRYKGRAVFRGDSVKDENDFYAVFSEQGTSATHAAGTKIIDTIAHMPGCAGEDSDAVSAYSQIKFADAARLLGKNVIPETWISL